MPARDSVILVHGLWMNGMEMSVLRRRLEHEHGFDAHVFAYPTLHGDAGEICRELAEFARDCGRNDSRVHLVGHSLGGAIIYKTLAEDEARVAGNTVLLASPLNGSRAAEGAARHPMLRPLLGPHVLRELAQPRGRRAWSKGAALGAIAGSMRMGTGQFFAHFDEEHDGSVAVSETVIPGLSDHIVLPHSHMGMIFAADVAAQVAHFLRNGRFEKSGKK
jgi:pimeloyl-ACP methyl ester carboxylesterase